MTLSKLAGAALAQVHPSAGGRQANMHALCPCGLRCKSLSAEACRGMRCSLRPAKRPQGGLPTFKSGQ
eukprot:14460249-Alexandrium_andersonii.AAC.1